MARDEDLAVALREAVSAAFATRTALRLRGGGTKDFCGRAPSGLPLEVASHQGVVAYEPTELVLTARAGTPLAAVEATLAASGQMLPFEPPAFGARATLGGTLACGLSGPRRPYAGAARDFVLGVRILNGRGEDLRFGGQVMKNVAGYDISRLMVGALGTLGVLLEASVKVLPRPEAETTLVLEQSAAAALATMNRLAGQPVPLSAACHLDGRLCLRLSGTESGVRAARARVGGVPAECDLWEALREHRLPFFQGAPPLWRLSVNPASPPIDLPGEWLLDWGGAQRWLRTPADPATVRAAATAAGGHATVFRGGDRQGPVFQPLPEGLLAAHQRLKDAFDPRRILNPGRLYPEL